MKTNEDLQKDVHNEIQSKSLLNTSRISVTMVISKHIKKAIYITSLFGVGLLFNSCVGGYITAEPTYVETSRPPQPSNLHIWIDGDWIWSYQTHAYVHQNGYWERPRSNRTYVAGYWQTSSKGKTWNSGRWQQNGRQRNNRHR